MEWLECMEKRFLWTSLEYWSGSTQSPSPSYVSGQNSKMSIFLLPFRRINIEWSLWIRVRCWVRWTPEFGICMLKAGATRLISLNAGYQKYFRWPSTSSHRCSLQRELEVLVMNILNDVTTTIENSFLRSEVPIKTTLVELINILLKILAMA